MSIFGRLFASDKAVDSILDNEKGLLVRAGNWVGGLHYTEEEKAEATQEVRQWGLQQLAALEPFKVVQRILAFGVTAVWGFVTANVVVAIWIEAIYGVTVTEKMLEFALSSFVFWPVLAVLSLYFTGGVLPGILSKGK